MTKKISKIVALVLALSVICLALVSCGKTLSGTYTAKVGGELLGTETSYKFSGSKVTITVSGTALGAKAETSFDGKYEITEEDGNQYIVFTFEGSDASQYSGKQSFSENKSEKTITISGIVFTKK